MRAVGISDGPQGVCSSRRAGAVALVGIGRRAARPGRAEQVFAGKVVGVSCDAPGLIGELADPPLGVVADRESVPVGMDQAGQEAVHIIQSDAVAIGVLNQAHLAVRQPEREERAVPLAQRIEVNSPCEGSGLARHAFKRPVSMDPEQPGSAGCLDGEVALTVRLDGEIPIVRPAAAKLAERVTAGDGLEIGSRERQRQARGGRRRINGARQCALWERIIGLLENKSEQAADITGGLTQATKIGGVFVQEGLILAERRADTGGKVREDRVPGIGRNQRRPHGVLDRIPVEGRLWGNEEQLKFL